MFHRTWYQPLKLNHVFSTLLASHNIHTTLTPFTPPPPHPGSICPGPKPPIYKNGYFPGDPTINGMVETGLPHRPGIDLQNCPLPHVQILPFLTF